MNFKKSPNRLDAELTGDFNLAAVHKIRRALSQREELCIDLQRARFVNSEAIIFLHRLIREKRKVRLKNPPKIFFEALRILGLHREWDLKNIVER